MICKIMKAMKDWLMDRNDEMLGLKKSLEPQIIIENLSQFELEGKKKLLNMVGAAVVTESDYLIGDFSFFLFILDAAISPARMHLMYLVILNSYHGWPGSTGRIR